MFRWTKMLVMLCGLVVVVSGCQQPIETSTQRMTHQMDYAKRNKFPHLTNMVDNAILYDMTIADLHFVPHTSELSGTGVSRLDRLVPILNTYGGVVRYETQEKNAKLVNMRMAHAREYLALAGCSMDHVEVKTMISGGRSRPASEAIDAMTRGTQLDPAIGGTAAGAGGGNPFASSSGN